MENFCISKFREIFRVKDLSNKWFHRIVRATQLHSAKNKSIGKKCKKKWSLLFLHQLLQNFSHVPHEITKI